MIMICFYHFLYLSSTLHWSIDLISTHNVLFILITHSIFFFISDLFYLYYSSNFMRSSFAFILQNINNSYFTFVKAVISHIYKVNEVNRCCEQWWWNGKVATRAHRIS